MADASFTYSEWVLQNGEDVFQDEDNGNRIHQDRDLLGFAAGQLDDDIGDEAEADTVGDGVSRRR